MNQSPATLLVRARLHQPGRRRSPGPMVFAFHTAVSGVRGFVGMVFDRDAEHGVTPRDHGFWRPTIAGERVPRCLEYMCAVIYGDLWAADQATADEVSRYAQLRGEAPVVFDPTYGGELKTLTKWLADVDEPRLTAIGQAVSAGIAVGISRGFAKGLLT